MKKGKPGTELPQLSYTRLLKQQRREREFWSMLGIADPELAPTEHHWLDFRSSRISNEDLALLVKRTERINMLDLNDTEITSEGIAALTCLRQLSELRIKDCANIDDSANPYIDRIQALKLLNIKGTKISVGGLLKLTHLKTLKELYLSTHDEENIDRQLEELYQLLMPCNLIVKGKNYSDSYRGNAL